MAVLIPAAIPVTFASAYNAHPKLVVVIVIDQFRGDLRFLNFPFMAQPERATKMLYALRGWYYRRGGGWIAVTVSDNGRLAAVSFDRMPSPDLVAAFKDPAASNQRFELQTFCSGRCVHIRKPPQNAAASSLALPVPL